MRAILLVALAAEAAGFIVPPPSHGGTNILRAASTTAAQTRGRSTFLSDVRLSAEGGRGESEQKEMSRRGAFAAIALSIITPAAAFAAEKDFNDCGKGWTPGRKWLTGKSCQEKGKDNQYKDNKGTKKDPKFLKSLQGCRADCQAPTGTSQETSSQDCIKACRDQVCTTYEQCTYQIGQKEDYGGFLF